jgi:hypothetical protein
MQAGEQEAPTSLIGLQMPDVVGALLNADRGNMDLQAKMVGVLSDTAASQVLILAAPGLMWP